MRKKRYYTYNPATLTYEPVHQTLWQKIIAVFRYLLVGSVIGVSAFGLANYALLQVVLKQDDEKMQVKDDLNLLNQQIDESLKVLDDIRQRDDNLYRVLMQADPIPAEKRELSLRQLKSSDRLNRFTDSELVISTSQKMDLLNHKLYVQTLSIDEIMEMGRKQDERLRNTPAIQPIANKDLKRTASGYGMRIDPIYRTPRFHEGMDFAAPVGTPVYATGDGVVVTAAREKDYGNAVVIDHGFGYKTRYAHLSKILVRPGTKVSRGEEIALVGNTGKSTGPHLHYEVRLKGTPMNPALFYYMDLSPTDYDKMIQLAENHGQMMD